MNYEIDKNILSTENCYVCGSKNLRSICTIVKKPQQEIDLGIKPEDYKRDIELCLDCGVYNNFHSYYFKQLYQRQYNLIARGKDILSQYKGILGLPEGKSINKQRIKRIVDFCKMRKIDLTKTKVLDVGSGLCVFLGEFLKYGIEAHCIDPDPSLVKHALNNVKVCRAFCGQFLDYKSSLKFNIITFNKILEHVKNPVALLKKARGILKNNGFVYLELPDGENALKNSPPEAREEFFIDHFTAFSEKSVRLLNRLAGLATIEIKSILEPSDKYSIYSFMGIAKN